MLLEVRNSIGGEELIAGTQTSNLPRSKSAQTLKSVPEGQEEHIVALSQLLWIAASLLESHLEHEFLLGAGLLDKVFENNIDCIVVVLLFFRYWICANLND